LIIKKRFIIYLSFISFLFSEVSYNTVQDNSFTPHPDYTWEMFYRSIKIDNVKPIEEQMRNARYWCTHKEDIFSTEYMTWVVPTFKDEKKSIEQAYVVFVEAFDKNGDYIQSGTELIVTEENFEDFRNVFSSSKSIRFENGFEVKYLKIKTAENQNQIAYYDGPGGNFIPDSTFSSRYRPFTYYIYGSIIRGQDKYVLLGVDNRLKKASTSKEKVLGWIKVEDDGEKQLAILWNSNIGLRPKVNYKRKPLAFENSKDGRKAIIQYMSYGQISKRLRESIIVGEGGISNYNRKYQNRNGQVTRWLPIYDPSLEESDNTMSIGITDYQYQFFTEALTLAKDQDGNLLFHVDVHIYEDKLYELWDTLDEYVLDLSLDGSKRLILNILAIFFNTDLGDIDNEFLNDKTLHDFWNITVGNSNVAKFLIPDLFNQNFTFKELIDALEDGDVEDTLFDNAMRIMDVIQHQIDTEFSKISFVSDFEEQKIFTYYWVTADLLNLFKGINIKN